MAEEKFETKADDIVDDRSWWQKVVEGVNRLWTDHKELVIMTVIGFFGGLVGLADAKNKSDKKKANHEKTYRTIYDRSKGNYVISKKDITPDQQREINRRRDAGEDIYDICRDLHIKLKR